MRRLLLLPGIVVTLTIATLYPGAAQALVVSGLTIRDGLARGPDGKSGSDAEANGGAVYIPDAFNLTGNFTATDCAFVSNTARAGDTANIAGGNAFGGAVDNSGNLTLVRCTFSNNAVIGGNASGSSAQAVGGNGYGGALSFYPGKGTTITNCTFANNSAAGGSGSHGSGFGIGGAVEFLNPVSSTIFTSCTIVDNTATGEAGRSSGQNGAGGVQIDNGSGLFRNTFIARNSASAPAVGKDVNGTFVSSSSFNLIGDGSGLSGITNGVQANR